MEYTVNSKITIKKLGPEFFVLDREKSVIHMFNTTGSLVWQEILNGRGFEEIVAIICDGYSVEEEVAADDVYEFLLLLVEKGLVSTSCNCSGD